MIVLERTDSSNINFHQLVNLLDADLAIKDGTEHEFYHQFNKIDSLKNIIVAFENNIAVGCGAFKEYDNNTVEIKRMFTNEKHRNKGIATIIVKELEQWAQQLGYTNAILETGKKQIEAIHLYPKLGYEIIENYGQYKNAANSLCFSKKLL